MRTPRHLPHLSCEECAERWPRLVRALRWVLLGSEGEAACCLRDYRDGLEWGSEAVSHSGLSPADRVRQACRAWTREALRDQLRCRQACCRAYGASLMNRADAQKDAR